jgi:hypothetical protein
MLTSIKRLAILATVLGAVLIPAVASARPVGPDNPYFVPGPAATPAQPIATTSVPGFKWDDAGFGAAATLVLVAIGAGATLVVRRRAVVG